ncbi:MAG: rubrerythrin [Bacteroidetes bacterium]|nr:MAG: rubrerythrin [Bacteroidota bacterium]
MKKFNSVEDILEFAIRAEQEAVDFYSDLAARSKNDQIKKVFLEFAGEEMKHKSRLLGIREEKTLKLSGETVRDMKIADYLVDVAPKPDMPYADALILAMKKEKKAFRLYSFLSDETTDLVMKSLFLNLAMEESRHKLRFEIEYDEFVLKEN